MNDTLPLNDSRDEIKFVTGERGKGMSTVTLVVRNERRTRLERVKEQLIAGLRWYHRNWAKAYILQYMTLAPLLLLVGLAFFVAEMAGLSAIFITLSCMHFILLGASMRAYRYGGKEL